MVEMVVMVEIFASIMSLGQEQVEMQQLQEQKRRGAICSVSQVISALNKQEQEAFNLACADQGIDGVTISTWLQKRGHTLRSWTINRHRRSMCSCAQ